MLKIEFVKNNQQVIKWSGDQLLYYLISRKNAGQYAITSRRDYTSPDRPVYQALLS